MDKTGTLLDLLEKAFKNQKKAEKKLDEVKVEIELLEKEIFGNASLDAWIQKAATKLKSEILEVD